MRSFIRKMFVMLLAVSVVFASTGINAFAEEEVLAETGPEYFSASGDTEFILDADEYMTNDEMLQGYLDRAFFGDAENGGGIYFQYRYAGFGRK